MTRAHVPRQVAAEQLGCCNDLAAGLGLAALAALQIMALLPLSDAGVCRYVRKKFGVPSV